MSKLNAEKAKEIEYFVHELNTVAQAAAKNPANRWWIAHVIMAAVRVGQLQSLVISNNDLSESTRLDGIKAALATALEIYVFVEQIKPLLRKQPRADAQTVARVMGALIAVLRSAAGDGEQEVAE